MILELLKGFTISLPLIEYWIDETFFSAQISKPVLKLDYNPTGNEIWILQQGGKGGVNYKLSKSMFRVS